MRIGVDLGGTKIEAIALADDGTERRRRRIATPAGSYRDTVAAVAGLVGALERDLGQRCSVGVGIPGTLSRATGRIKNANSTWLNGRPLDADLERALGRSVRLANDANCFALSEAVDGAAAGAEVAFGVIVGTGTGAGIVVRGRVLTGANGVAGEWGHNPLPWPCPQELPGPACYCGRRGCIETYLSGPGLVSDFSRGGGEPALQAAGQTAADSASDVVRLAEAGHAGARAALERYVDRMARGLAHVINVLDPDVIVLGGGLSNIGHLYEEVPRRWGGYVFSDRVDTRLVPPRHGDSSGVRGAAWLWPPHV